jgi:hypothetical protein
VALFFILTGFVNSLKPLKQAHADDAEGALLALARSSFARVPRLVFPAATVTVIAWLACQLGAFELARHSSAYWMQVNSYPPSQTWRLALRDLMRALAETWLWGENRYDQPQWALPYLLKASIYIFVLLLFTTTNRSAFRFILFGLSYAWSWVSGDGTTVCKVNATNCELTSTRDYWHQRLCRHDSRRSSFA